MKKIIMMAVAAFMAFTANAQTEAGTFTLQPKVGISLANMTDYEDSKMKVGLAAGVEAEYAFASNMSVAAGVLYSMQGAKADEGDFKTKMDYINIPIVFNYYIIPGLAVKAGVQPAFLVNAKADDGDEDEDIKDLANSFDLSIPVGLSYEYKSFVLDARYNIGMTKIWKSDYEELLGKSKNSVFQITLGYKFAL